MGNLEKVREDEELLEPKGPVGVNPVVHRRVVADLVRGGALAVGPEYPVDVAAVILEGVQALQDGGLCDEVLALRES